MSDAHPSTEQCPLIDRIIHCRCGKPSSHYGTMGVRGAREVREDPPSAETNTEPGSAIPEIGSQDAPAGPRHRTSKPLTDLLFRLRYEISSGHNQTALHALDELEQRLSLETAESRIAEALRIKQEFDDSKRYGIADTDIALGRVCAALRGEVKASEVSPSESDTFNIPGDGCDLPFYTPEKEVKRCRHNMNPATCDTCWATGSSQKTDSQRLLDAGFKPNYRPLPDDDPPEEPSSPRPACLDCGAARMTDCVCPR